MIQKPHKFFDKYLDNDLNRLSKFLLKQYDKIQNKEIDGITPLDKQKDYWVESGSLSTIKWNEYNVFQFYNNEIYNLFSGLRSVVKEACDYYEINYDEQKYMVQGWFNINYNTVGKLDWHDHGPTYEEKLTKNNSGNYSLKQYMNFHGYYCVNAEPSVTHYLIDNERPFENINKNNRLILSQMGHPHAMSNWEWDGPRITIAYDVASLYTLENDDKQPQQHWIPL